MNQSTEIEVKNLDHLGLVAGIIGSSGFCVETRSILIVSSTK